MRPTINASHLGTTIAAQARAAWEESLLARERALRPTEPAPAPRPSTPAPRASTSKPKPKPPAPKAKRPPSRAGVAVGAQEAKRKAPTPKALPPGWMLLDPPTSRAVRRLIATHPQTKGL